MKFIILSLTLFITFGANAQKLHVNVFAGTSNYQGDLQDKRLTFNQSHLAIGGGLSYELTEKLLLNGGITFGKISADDKNNNKNTLRNLNFSSGLTEEHLTAEYYFRNLYDYSFSPYVFAGIAVYHFNPYTKDSIGNKYFIKPYYSHEINLRKPGKECFEFVLKKENLNTEETLFIDDSETNIEAAKTVGLNTIYLPAPHTILELNL